MADCDNDAAAPILANTPVAEVVQFAPLTRRVRILLVVLLCIAAASQGAAWALFTSVPPQAQQLFGLPSGTQDVVALTWTMNANNIGQAAATPLSTWLVFGDGGLRKVAVASSVVMIAQQVLWVLAIIFFHGPASGPITLSADDRFGGVGGIGDIENASSSPSPSTAPAPASATSGDMGSQSIWAMVFLCVGAAAGGCGNSFVQGCISRFSAEWFEAEYRARVTAILYCQTCVQCVRAFYRAVTQVPCARARVRACVRACVPCAVGVAW
jgi:hypothetical protein